MSSEENVQPERVKLVYTEGDFGRYDLFHADSAAFDVQAARCKTWSEYCRVIGTSWQEFLKEYEEELEYEFDEELPGPDDSFSYLELWMMDCGVVSGGEPRDAAYEVLPRRLDYDSDPILREELEWSGGSPAGHTCCVTSRSERGFERLAEFLRENGYGHIEIEADDGLIGEWCEAMHQY